MALEYYKKKDHYRYVTLFEQLQSVYKGTFRADTIEFYLAQGYYHQGDYLLAGHQFDMFRKTTNGAYLPRRPNSCMHTATTCRRHGPNSISQILF